MWTRTGYQNPEETQEKESPVNTNSVVAIANVLPSISILSQNTRRTGRAGRKLRLYRAEAVVAQDSAVTAAVKALLAAGHGVKTYEGSRVLTARLADDGAVVWSSRSTHRVRETAVVEVIMSGVRTTRTRGLRSQKVEA